MSTITSAEVIINARSGFDDNEERSRRLGQLFASNGVTVNISLARAGGELVEVAQRGVRGNRRVVVAAGGDGTINAVAAALIGSDKILGVLPLGTLNHFAQDLLIPLVVEDAARVIISGHTIAIDVGEVNGHIFLNNSSLGLYPIIVHERERQQRLGFGKWPAFVWAAITVLRRYAFLKVRVESRGQVLRCSAPFVFIGNNEDAMEGFKICPRAQLDRGQLSGYMTP